MKEVNITPQFIPHCSNVPWIERVEAKGWKVSNKAKYECGVVPSAYWCKEYEVVFGRYELDCFYECAKNDGVKVNIYFAEEL